MLSEPGFNACHHNAVQSKHMWSYLHSFTTSYDVSFGAPKVDLHLCGIPKWWNRSHAKHHSWSSWKSSSPGSQSEFARIFLPHPVEWQGSLQLLPSQSAAQLLGASPVQLVALPHLLDPRNSTKAQVTTKWKVILLLCYCMVTSGY